MSLEEHKRRERAQAIGLFRYQLICPVLEPALEKDIREWITAWNENPKPFAWTKTADEILDRLTAYLQRIPGAGHQVIVVAMLVFNAAFGFLQQGRARAVDLNADHLAACGLDSSGNPLGDPTTVAVDTAGLAAGRETSALQR